MSRLLVIATTRGVPKNKSHPFASQVVCKLWVFPPITKTKLCDSLLMRLSVYLLSPLLSNAARKSFALLEPGKSGISKRCQLVCKCGKVLIKAIMDGYVTDPQKRGDTNFCSLLQYADPAEYKGFKRPLYIFNDKQSNTLPFLVGHLNIEFQRHFNRYDLVADLCTYNSLYRVIESAALANSATNQRFQLCKQNQAHDISEFAKQIFLFHVLGKLPVTVPIFLLVFLCFFDLYICNQRVLSSHFGIFFTLLYVVYSKLFSDNPFTFLKNFTSLLWIPLSCFFFKDCPHFTTKRYLQLKFYKTLFEFLLLLFVLMLLFRVCQ